MRLKNILLVVRDIEKSKTFYRELFGLEVVTDFGDNVIMTEGLVLQKQSSWEKLTGKMVSGGGNDCELYFEENDLDLFLERLKRQEEPVEYMNQCTEYDWGRRVVRIYDPDRHVIEVSETMDYVVRRFLNQGMSAEAVAEKTGTPLWQVECLVEN